MNTPLQVARKYLEAELSRKTQIRFTEGQLYYLRNMLLITLPDVLHGVYKAGIVNGQLAAHNPSYGDLTLMQLADAVPFQVNYSPGETPAPSEKK